MRVRMRHHGAATAITFNLFYVFYGDRTPVRSLIHNRMFNRKYLFLSLAAVCAAEAYSQQPASYVDPFIGTVKMGHTFPGACGPHGAVRLSPDASGTPHNMDGVYQTCLL